MSGNKKITISRKIGSVTVKKGLKKGTYKVRVKVPSGKSPTNISRTITVRIRVK